MIRVNLLHSVTERNNGAVVAVERKMSSPESRMMVMSIVVMIMLMAGIGWHYMSVRNAKLQAEADIAEQQKIASELEAVLKEQQELEAKIKNIDIRIEAIKKLRASQAGPSAVLDALRERIGMTPGIYLKSVEQTGDKLVVTGESPDAQAVTQFGRSLEFSGGLFSNLSIETQRQEATASQTAGGAAAVSDVVNFVITCSYTPSKAGGNADNSVQANNGSAPDANQPAGQTPPQVAKNQE